MHQLDGAYERVARSNEHLVDLKSVSDKFISELDTQFGTPDRNGRPILNIPPQYIPLRISVLVGEVVYNLRSALDYLIYELACFDSKQIVRGTQFPIEDTPRGFGSRIGMAGTNKWGVYLAGVSDIHVKGIRELQPYNGCDWTRTLRSISNIDKHIHLTIVERHYTVDSNSAKETRHTNGSMTIEFKVTRYISFSDGSIVIETLEQLHSEVTKVLDLFKPDFE